MGEYMGFHGCGFFCIECGIGAFAGRSVPQAFLSWPR